MVLIKTSGGIDISLALSIMVAKGELLGGAEKGLIAPDPSPDQGNACGGKDVSTPR